MEQVLKTMLENVRAKSPLVHNITNYVTVNDVANVLLAAGGSPIMSDDADDVEDMQSLRRLCALPGDYEVYPGHMDSTTLERERNFNYYCREASK